MYLTFLSDYTTLLAVNHLSLFLDLKPSFHQEGCAFMCVCVCLLAGLSNNYWMAHHKPHGSGKNPLHFGADANQREDPRISFHFL